MFTMIWCMHHASRRLFRQTLHQWVQLCFGLEFIPLIFKLYFNTHTCVSISTGVKAKNCVLFVWNTAQPINQLHQQFTQRHSKVQGRTEEASPPFCRLKCDGKIFMARHLWLLPSQASGARMTQKRPVRCVRCDRWTLNGRMVVVITLGVFFLLFHKVITPCPRAIFRKSTLQGDERIRMCWTLKGRRIMCLCRLGF